MSTFLAAVCILQELQEPLRKPCNQIDGAKYAPFIKIGIYLAATTSISTLAPFGRLATAKAALAG